MLMEVMGLHLPGAALVHPNTPLRDALNLAATSGLGLVMRELLGAGLLHPDIRCVHGGDLYAQAREPVLENERLRWGPTVDTSLDTDIVRPVAEAATS